MNAYNGYVSVRELAEALQLDRSGVRRKVLKMGYTLVKMRLRGARGQKGNCLREQDAREVIEYYSTEIV